MRKLLSLLLGLLLGAAIGSLLVMLFSPVSGPEVRQRLKRGYDETLAAAKTASEQRRAELEAELQQLQR